MRFTQGVHKGRFLKALFEEYGNDVDTFCIYLSNAKVLVINVDMKIKRAGKEIDD